MWRLGLVVLALAMLGGEAQAQYWGQPSGRQSPYYRSSPGFFGFWGWDDPYYRRRYGPRFQSGGERPVIEPMEPKKIAFTSTYAPSSIIIDSAGRQLFFVLSDSEALHYPISVGREGFSWSGKETISRKAEWPDWHPPDEMRWRDPRLPEKMSGGLKNPLGAMALYLGSSLYRIHGTNDAKSIGRAASSGCFRMLNGHIVDLAARAEIGTAVTVVPRLPPELAKMVADQVTPPEERVGAKRARPS
jgi:lipoprotein-anchoring transpeptidase ErfK/SrfK